MAHTTLHRFHERMPGELGVERLTEARAASRRAADAPLPAGGAGQRADPVGGGRQGGGAAAGARPGGLHAQRGRVRVAAGAARLRGALRHQELACRTSSRGCGWTASRCPARSTASTATRACPRAAMVWDYKTGKGAKSAAQIETERKLQLPLYILVAARPARDRAGGRPVPGAGRRAQGARDGGQGRDRGRDAQRPAWSPAEFWAQVERAVGYANAIVARVRAGDVRHDPIGRSCPEWCLRQAGGICRVAR